MSARATLATARRVAEQLRRDRRTLALVLIVPPALLALLKAVLRHAPEAFARVGAPLIGTFPLIMMFLIASIAMLRERSSGTLERLMTLPIGKLDVLAGYGLAFAGLATLQGCVTSAVAFGLLGVHVLGPVSLVVVLAVANAVLGMAFGLLLSAFATTEFQAVQFMPAFVLPQLLLCGLIVPRVSMAAALRAVSDVLPFTYAYDAVARVAADDVGLRLAADAAVVTGCVAVALALGAATLRRRTS